MRTFILAMLAAFGLAVGIALLSGWDTGMGNLKHVEGHAQGLAQARQLGRPPIFFFTDTW